MLDNYPVKQLNDFLWEIPQTYRDDMRAPARFYGSRKLLEDIGSDKSLEQLTNTATLPGIVDYALAMPDMHQGYGFPIGGVVATDPENDGIISPGGVGYDINCGVRLVAATLKIDEAQTQLERFLSKLYQTIPSGVGKGRSKKISARLLNDILDRGVEQMLKEGYAAKDDLEHIESNGRLPDADHGTIGDHAKNRGLDQLGSLGSGNHFLEVQQVVKILDPDSAEAFGLTQDQLVIMIHSGSRGLGHQVATDYMNTFKPKLSAWGINLPDQELVCAPFNSPEGQNYYHAMNAAANFAFSNRQMMTYQVRKTWQDVYGSSGGDLKLVYDVAHNMAKLEAGLLVHRKGAIRAFPAGHRDIPKAYRNTGHPVLIPGSMGTASYVLVGKKKALNDTFGTVCHGAGRRLSRSQAKKQVWGEDLKSDLESQGIIIRSESMPGLAEEAPAAYKDIHEVIRIIENAGLAKAVVQLKPMGVVKGS